MRRDQGEAGGGGKGKGLRGSFLKRFEDRERDKERDEQKDILRFMECEH